MESSCQNRPRDRSTGSSQQLLKRHCDEFRVVQWSTSSIARLPFSHAGLVDTAPRDGTIVCRLYSSTPQLIDPIARAWTNRPERNRRRGKSIAIDLPNMGFDPMRRPFWLTRLWVDQGKHTMCVWRRACVFWRTRSCTRPEESIHSILNTLPAFEPGDPWPTWAFSQSVENKCEYFKQNCFHRHHYVAIR